MNWKRRRAVRRHQRRALLLGAVHLGRNQHAVPVHQLRRVGVVDDLDRDRLAFAHAQHRAGRSAVVADGGENVRAVELDRHRRDAQGVVGLARPGAAPGSALRHRDCGCASSGSRDAGLRQRHAAEFREDRAVSRCAASGSRMSDGRSYLHPLTRRPSDKLERCRQPAEHAYRPRALQPTVHSVRLYRQRSRRLWYSRARSPVAEVLDEALASRARAGVAAAACCAGRVGFPADRRLRLWQRRLAQQRQGRVLLVAPGLHLQHGKLSAATAVTAGGVARPGRATIPRPTASFSSPCTGSRASTAGRRAGGDARLPTTSSTIRGSTPCRCRTGRSPTPKPSGCASTC